MESWTIEEEILNVKVCLVFAATTGIHRRFSFLRHHAYDRRVVRQPEKLPARTVVVVVVRQTEAVVGLD